MTLYVSVDDLCQSNVRLQRPASRGPEPRESDNEALCLALAAQWRGGMLWNSEHGLVRDPLAHLQPLFAAMTSQSALNRRLRRLLGAGIPIQQAVADRLVHS